MWKLEEKEVEKEGKKERKRNVKIGGGRSWERKKEKCENWSRKKLRKKEREMWKLEEKEVEKARKRNVKIGGERYWERKKRKIRLKTGKIKFHIQKFWCCMWWDWLASGEEFGGRRICWVMCQCKMLFENLTWRGPPTVDSICHSLNSLFYARIRNNDVLWQSTSSVKHLQFSVGEIAYISTPYKSLTSVCQTLSAYCRRQYIIVESLWLIRPSIKHWESHIL